jgi:hypothetical protein
VTMTENPTVQHCSCWTLRQSKHVDQGEQDPTRPESHEGATKGFDDEWKQSLDRLRILNFEFALNLAQTAVSQEDMRFFVRFQVVAIFGLHGLGGMYEWRVDSHLGRRRYVPHVHQDWQMRVL